jgi:hypothetical protein
MRKTVGVVVLVIALLLVLGEMFLPWVVARGLEIGLQRTLGQGEDMQVSLRSRPAVRMITGRIDTLTIETKQIETATLAIDSMAMTVHDISVNLGAILTRSQLVVSRANEASVVIRISAANLRRYVLDNVRGLSQPQVKLTQDRVAIAGDMSFAGTPVLVAIQGRFVADGDRKIRLAVDQLSIDGVQLPEQATGTIIAALGGAELFIDVSRFPLPLTLKQVEMTDGWLIIRAATPTR